MKLYYRSATLLITGSFYRQRSQFDETLRGRPSPRNYGRPGGRLYLKRESNHLDTYRCWRRRINRRNTRLPMTTINIAIPTSSRAAVHR
jgi:hypothetical protein